METPITPENITPATSLRKATADDQRFLFDVIRTAMQPVYEAALAGMDVRKVQAKAIQDDFTIVGKPAEALEVFNKLVKKL